MSRELQQAVALADGSYRGRARFLAADAEGWFADPTQGLGAAVDPVRGADDVARALARLAPSSLRIVASVVRERTCWAEIDRRAGAVEETGILGLSCDDGGKVSRVVLLRAPLVPASEAGMQESVPDAQPLLERYFADLMRSRFREAAAHFTLDTIYSHPPYGGGTERALFRGRDALRRGFVTERGESPARQLITGFWQQHDHVFLEGVIEGVPHGGTFVSTAQINARGEIARYVAFYSARRIPARTAARD